MHCVIEGVTKKLGELWFDTQFSEKSFNISNLIDIVDEKLLLIEPPAYVVRRSRSLKTHFKYWKASEHKNWFYYFSIPILNGLLPPEYLNHYKHLVLAIFLLSKKEVTHEMINLSEKLIFEFVSQFEHLYGLKYMTCNVHSLLHLPTVVRCLGPLWTTSCFPLEDVNGKIKNFVHGSKNPELQIAFNLNMFLKVHTLKYDWLKKDSDIYLFCDRLLSPQRRLRLTNVDRSIYIVGIASKIKALEAEQILTKYDLSGKNVFSFKKLYKNNVLFTSKAAQKNQGTQSFSVTYVDESLNDSVGCIQKYIRIMNCDCKRFCTCPGKHYAFIQKIKTLNPFFVNIPGGTLKHIFINVQNYLIQLC